jgi:NADH-quinone oxidoreductase subunit A
MVLLGSAYSYQPIAWLIGIAVAMAAAMFGAAHMIGPKRMGPVKGTPYEAGMPPIGSTQSRFDIRFYMVAMIFLLFDVEVALLWPWAGLFTDSTRASPQYPATQHLLAGGIGSGYLFVEVVIFVLILLIGYVYAWRKGVFKFS